MSGQMNAAVIHLLCKTRDYVFFNFVIIMERKDFISRLDALIWRPSSVNEREISALLDLCPAEDIPEIRHFVNIQKGMGEQWEQSVILRRRGLDVTCRCRLIDSLLVARI